MRGLIQRSRALFVICIAGLLLMACGGGGGSSSDDATASIDDVISSDDSSASVDDAISSDDSSASVDDGISSDDATASVDDGVCGVTSQKAFVRDVAQSWYLWVDELADPDPADYTTAQAYLDALIEPLFLDGRDPRFSYVTTQQEDQASFATGAYIGFGFRYTQEPFNAGEQWWFLDVLEGSPAGDAGLTRGQQILAIDTGSGFETVDELTARDATITEIFGPSDVGVERGFRVREGGAIKEVTLVKRELDTPPLAGQPLLIERLGLSPVGYFHLRGFQDNATQPLIEATTLFAEAGVTDMVIDLRYNSGGSIEEAYLLLDLIGGIAAQGEESFRLAHNRLRAQAEDISRFFEPRTGSMNPLRIAFITTGGSASASEMIINSLEPWFEVVLVGEDTLGKAVGQYAFSQTGCDTLLRLVSFELVNGEGLGGWYEGLAATGRFTLCPAEDDYTRGFGDPEEASLQVALDWLNSGVCGDSTASSRSQLRGLYRGPSNAPMVKPLPGGRSVWQQ